MRIIGGSYSEICFEPIWENIFGSGFRATNLILQLSQEESITFTTCCDSEIKSHLLLHEKLYPNLKLDITEIPQSPNFYYDHPLQTPKILPRPDVYKQTSIRVDSPKDNFLVYGMLEANIKVNGNKVIYDPQSPANPKSFSSTGSTAKELITIVNLSEARKISNSNNIEDVKNFFLEKQGCKILILKMGAKGAIIFQNNREPIHIPVYETEKVWPIGSGDVFSAYFAYEYFNGNTIKESAVNASKATSLYCNSKDLSISIDNKEKTFIPRTIKESPQGQIYLAGPFFTFGERWLINETWEALKSFGLKVFSPFHDVGHGKAKDVVGKDIEGLENSDVVLALIDGLDSGTLFEVGYAVSRNIKVVAFVQNEGEESIKMLEGTNCIIEKDFATAIYKAYWTLAST